MFPARMIFLYAGLLLWIAGCTFSTDSSSVETPIPVTLQPVDQENDTSPVANRTIFDGVTFSFDSSFARSGSAQKIPQNLDPSGFTYFDIPEHYRFEFLAPYTGQPPFLEFQASWSVWTAHQNLTASLLQPQVFIFPVEAFNVISPRAGDRIDELRALLDGKPPPEGTELPVLPMFNSAQDLRVQLKSIDFLNGRGIRFLTRYTQDASPVINPTLFYTFQGLSEDGLFYVAAFFPIYVSGLPDEVAVQDWESFNLMYQDYLYQLANDLDALPAADFEPDLAKLDSLIGSMEVRPGTLPPLELRLGSGRTEP